MANLVLTDTERARQLAGTAQFLAVSAFVMIVASLVFSIGGPTAALIFSDNPFTRERVHEIGLLLLDALPALLLCEAVNQLSRALQYYEKGEFFGRNAPEKVAKAGDLALEAMIAAMLVVPTLRLWVSGEGGLDIRFEPEYAGMLAFALFISLTGRILSAAAGLKEENDAFI